MKLFKEFLRLDENIFNDPSLKMHLEAIIKQDGRADHGQVLVLARILSLNVNKDKNPSLGTFEPNISTTVDQVQAVKNMSDSDRARLAERLLTWLNEPSKTLAWRFTGQ